MKVLVLVRELVCALAWLSQIVCTRTTHESGQRRGVWQGMLLISPAVLELESPFPPVAHSPALRFLLFPGEPMFVDSHSPAWAAQT